MDESQENQYTELKKQVGEGLLSGAQQHDKAILTLSAGALALSLVFISDIAKNPSPETLPFLAWSWGILVVSMCLVLCSFHASMYAFRCHGKHLDTLRSKPETDPSTLKNSWNVATLALNFAALVCFVVGAILLLLFAYINLTLRLEEKTMSDEEKPLVTHGAPMPTLPVARKEPLGAPTPTLPVAQEPKPDKGAPTPSLPRKPTPQPPPPKKE